MAERFNESAPLKTSVRCLVLFSLSCRQHWTSEYYVSSSQYILTLWAMDGGGEFFLHIKTMEGNVKFVVNREPHLPIGWICHGGCSERFGVYITLSSPTDFAKVVKCIFFSWKDSCLEKSYPGLSAKRPSWLLGQVVSHNTGMARNPHKQDVCIVFL